MPQSKSQFFSNIEKDATNKCLALKVETIYPNGAKQGSVIVDAIEPWKRTAGEFKNMAAGKTMYALAVDHERGELVFPGPRGQKAFVPFGKILRLCEKTGVPFAPDFLTGLYWRLELQTLVDKRWLAEPLEILI